jgi:hypothetical protein
MSADKYSLFYCLSETGWSTITEEQLPDGWVRIYELKVYQGSPFGRESQKWQQPKTHPDWTNDAADQLEKKFPKPEGSRELSPEILKALGNIGR